MWVARFRRGRGGPHDQRGPHGQVHISSTFGAHGWRTPFWLYATSLPLCLLTARYVWQPPQHAETGRKLPPLPWRTLLAPLGVTLIGGLVFYVLIVELSYVLTGLGVTSATTIPVAISAAVLTGLGDGLLLPSALTWTLNSLDFDQRGRGTGIWTSALFLGQFICPLVVLALSGALGGLPVALMIVGAVAVAVAVGTRLPHTAPLAQPRR